MPEIVAYNVAYGISHLVLNPEQASYVILQYLPEFRKSIKGAVFVESKVEEVKYMFGGVLSKIGYAFLWQEFFIPISFMYNEFGITLGAMGMAYLNHNVNSFSGIKQTDERINNFMNVYPGDT